MVGAVRLLVVVLLVLALSVPCLAEPVGRWRLASLGYLSGYVPATGQSGVVAYDSTRFFDGLNFYTSGHAPEAVLVDMDGNVVHTWKKEAHEVWPDLPKHPAQNSALQWWRRAKMLPNGDILAIIDGQGIVRLNWDSEVIWKSRCGAHHDLDIAPNGDIWTLGRNKEGAMHVDYIVALDSNGKLLDLTSLRTAFRASEYRDIFDDRPMRRGDVFHTNSIKWLCGSLVLISIRNMNAVAIVDCGRGTVAWVTTGDFYGQHDATLLPDGRILLFGNNWSEVKKLEKASAVIEIGGSGKTAWEYRPGPGFYSATCGAAQRLPNGNTLITESDRGRALEITGGGDIVWEFLSPHRAGEDGELVATLFFVDRVGRD